MSATAIHQEEPFKFSNIVTLTARLAQVLAEEVDLLSQMKVSKIEGLQKEKLFLTSALETQKKLLARQPQVLETIPSQDKAEMEEMANIFNGIMEENHRKLTLAREVNKFVVQAITRVAKENTASRYYDGKGGVDVPTSQALSVTLDKTV